MQSPSQTEDSQHKSICGQQRSYDSTARENQAPSESKWLRLEETLKIYSSFLTMGRDTFQLKSDTKGLTLSGIEHP